VGGKTAAEQLTIDRMKGAAAQRAGDTTTAIAAFESVYERGSGAEKAQMAEQIAFAYSQQKNNAKASEWVAKAKAAGANTASLNQLAAFLQGSSGDYAQIQRDAQAAVAAAEKDGRKPGEDDLLRLADAARRTNSNAVYSTTLEKLVLYYPKKDYWSAHLASIQRKPGFADRLGLDVQRLKLANGLMTKADEYMELAQLALQAGLPDEAKVIVDKGYASGALGTGDQAARHQRLKDLVLKSQAQSAAGLAKDVEQAQAAKSGDELVKVGTIYHSMGQHDKAIELIEKGIAKGGLKRPDDARLRLALAMAAAPKSKAKGLQALRSVGGNDGTAEVARLYTVVMQ
jgi:tetratricopeptide (TPR) repeat protein